MKDSTRELLYRYFTKAVDEELDELAYNTATAVFMVLEQLRDQYINEGLYLVGDTLDDLIREHYDGR